MATYYMQATTQKLHSDKSCSITRRTRYNHFEVEVAEADLHKHVLCAKCFDVEKPAPSRI